MGFIFLHYKVGHGQGGHWLNLVEISVCAQVEGFLREANEGKRGEVVVIGLDLFGVGLPGKGNLVLDDVYTKTAGEGDGGAESRRAGR